METLSEKVNEQEKLIDFMERQKKKTQDDHSVKIVEVERSKAIMMATLEDRIRQEKFDSDQKDEKMKQLQERKEMAERELHTVRMEKLDLTAKIAENKADYESELRTLRHEIRDKSDIIENIFEKHQQKENKLLEQNRGLLQQVSELRAELADKSLRAQAQTKAL